MNSHNFPSTEYYLKLGKPKTDQDNQNYQLLDKDKCDIKNYTDLPRHKRKQTLFAAGSVFL